MFERIVPALCIPCIVLCLLAAPAPALAQQVGATVYALDPGPWVPDMGRVSIPITCQAFVYIDPYGPMMEFDLWVDLYVDGMLVQSGREQAYGFGVEVVVQSTAEVALSDVAVSCLAHGTLGGMSDHLILPGRIPGNVTTEMDSFQFYSPGSYLRTRHYRVWDNYDRWFSFSGTPVTEAIWTSGANGCNITGYAIGTGSLNSEAKFEDKYGDLTGGNAPIPACLLESHRGCVTYSTQAWSIASWVYMHPIEWRCDNVVVYR